MFRKKNTRIFLDYAAATPMSERALHAYVDAARLIANPQALHTEGLEAAKVRDEARGTIAKAMGVKSQELVFTSGGTESNNLALLGYVSALEEQGHALADMHIVTSSIEHPSISQVSALLKQRGVAISVVQPNSHGEIKAEAVLEAIQENTVLVSVALVNSEIGTVQPLHAIAKALNKQKPVVGGKILERILLHTDACQGMYQSLAPQGLGADLMSLDSGKMYGPRGVGVLYVRRGVPIAPVLRGGSQESGIRPGTENIALYAGFAAAFENVATMRSEEASRLHAFRTELYTALEKELPDIVCNGDAKKQSPHILNISIPNIDAQYVAMYLDQRGVALTTKSACLSRSDTSVSHVVQALGGDSWRATNTLRLSFGRDSTEKLIPTIIAKIVDAVQTYRSF